MIIMTNTTSDKQLQFSGSYVTSAGKMSHNENVFFYVVLFSFLHLTIFKIDRDDMKNVSRYKLFVSVSIDKNLVFWVYLFKIRTRRKTAD